MERHSRLLPNRRALQSHLVCAYLLVRSEQCAQRPLQPSTIFHAMTLAEFFSEFETTASLPPGTVQGQERLDSIERWGSFALVEFMSMADGKLGVQLGPAPRAACRPLGDLGLL